SGLHPDEDPLSRGVARRYLVAYDITSDKRRGKVFSTLFGFGDWTQYSVFLCDLTEQDLVRLRGLLRSTINQVEDQVIILDLGRASHPLDDRLEVLGKSYDPPIRSFII